MFVCLCHFSCILLVHLFWNVSGHSAAGKIVRRLLGVTIAIEMNLFSSILPDGITMITREEFFFNLLRNEQFTWDNVDFELFTR